MIEFEECSIAHLGPLMLPKVRCGRPQRPWWEAARLHSMRHYLGAGDRLLDVGSEMGDMSALFASWGVDVFLVEPNPKAWPWIRATFEANDLQPAGWSMQLLGAPDDIDKSVGGLILGAEYIERHGFEWPSIHANWMAPGIDYDNPDPETGFWHLDEHKPVGVVSTVDHLVFDVGFIPTAITIDIEGGEIKLIDGMIDTIERHQPIVWMSIHPEFIRNRYGESDGAYYILQSFRSYDYEPVFLAKDHEEHWMFLPKEMGWKW